MENSTINIGQVITDTINTLFSELFSSIDNSIYSILDDITFIDSSIISDNNFQSILGTSTTNGILIIANTLLIGLFLYYTVSKLISYFTGSEVQYSIRFIFKLIIFGILMNSSYFICEQIINLNSLISLAIRNIGETLYSKDICFSTLVMELNSTITIDGNSLNIFSVDGLIKSFISIGLFNLIFAYSLRYILIKIFVLICPFAILSLSFEKTRWFFTSWLRSFLSLLLLQILISLVLLVSFSFSFSQDFLSKLMYIGCIYALTKSNSIIREFIRWNFNKCWLSTI